MHDATKGTLLRNHKAEPMDREEKARVDALLSGSPYEVVGQLGEGAFAEVYVVRQTFIRKKFALKLIRPHLAADSQYVERVRVEARTLGRIENPHVVRIADLATAKNGAPYLVLELMEGRSLADELSERRRLPRAEAVRWASQALRGLSAAHDLGLIHRDITPANLFLQEVPSSQRVLKVMDFGLARVLPDFGDSAVRGNHHATTSTGMIVGSPIYASPEAFRGERLTAAADIYGVGLVLFQMLTGRGPLELDGTNVPPASEFDPSVPAGLDEVIQKATRPSPRERHRSAIEFLADLLPFTEKF